MRKISTSCATIVILELIAEITLTIGATLEISYIKKFSTIFDDTTFRDLYSPVLLKEKIIQIFQSKIFALNKEDPLFEFKKKYYENKMEEELEAVENHEKSKKLIKEKITTLTRKLWSVLTLEKIKC